jgi:hypothetical protein
LAYAPDGSKERRSAFTSCIVYYAGDLGPHVLAILDDCLDPLVRKVSNDRVEIYFLAGAHSHFRQQWKLLGNSARLEKQEAIEWSEDPRNAGPQAGTNQRQPSSSETNPTPAAAASRRLP